MLGDHADAGLDRVFGRMDGHQPALHQDLAFIGVVQPVQDAHQGGFSGAVFTQQGMDFPLAAQNGYGCWRSNCRSAW